MDLESLRDQIDQIDKEIISRLNERVRLAQQVGHLKLKEGKAIYVPSREEEVFRKLAANNGGPLTDKAIRAIYREVISAAIASEKQTTVAYLGPEGTYTHQAAMKNFGSSIDYVPLKSIPDVFDRVQRGEADYGVVPIENSTQGTVIAALDMLAETDLTIIAQVHLDISHCLISHAQSLKEIKTVHSKDNALGQCRQWLANTLPGVELIEATSTAAAVRYAAEHRDAAAIASSIAAQLYDVPILQENVVDKQNNITRFLVIGKQPTPPLGNKQDKTSLVFSIRDETGALMKAIHPFSSRNINLCKIESRPSRRKVWDYYFYVDIIGHQDEPDVREALAELRDACPFFKLLGSYPNT
ncbi:MAG: prephenate dehydratase [Opitutales bacterium]|nr:prephenate dehydratase [Opitutales bacterium]